MAEIIILTNKQREMLSKYEDILSKKTFKGQNKNVGYEDTTDLAIIYKDITRIDVTCKGGCDDKAFIKRLSFWYFGNRFGTKEESNEANKRGGLNYNHLIR